MATPAGITMAPELSALFMIPTNILRRRRDGADSPARKRARLANGEEEDDEAVEYGRRVERNMSERYRESSRHKDDTIDEDANEPNLQNDEPMFGDDQLNFNDAAPLADSSSLPDLDLRRSATPGLARERLMSEARTVRAPSVAPSVMASPDDCPIGFFDARNRSDGAPIESQSQTQAAASQYLVEDEASQADARERGFSQNTVKAVGFLRNEFSDGDGGIDENKTISFREKATKVCWRC
jgi:hypothetical protein